jgi:hypothetical protein
MESFKMKNRGAKMKKGPQPITIVDFLRRQKKFEERGTPSESSSGAIDS